MVIKFAFGGTLQASLVPFMNADADLGGFPLERKPGDWLRNCDNLWRLLLLPPPSLLLANTQKYRSFPSRFSA